MFIWLAGIAVLAVVVCGIVALVRQKNKPETHDEELYVNPSPVGGLPIGTFTPNRTVSSVAFSNAPQRSYIAPQPTNDSTGDLLTGVIIGEMMADHSHTGDSSSSSSSFAGFGGGESGGGGASGSWDSSSSSPSDSSSSYDSSSSSDSGSSFDSSSSSDTVSSSSDW